MAQESAIVLGLDIGGTHLRATLARGAHPLASCSAAWSADPAADEWRQVVSLAQECCARHSEAPQAVGVALAASINDDGVVTQWPNRPHWRDLPIRALLEQQLGLPLVFDDDANAAAIAEARLGAGRGLEYVLVVTVGTGIGAGIIIHQRLFRGRHGWAGEFGHMCLLPDGPRCSCGRHGCVQALASGRALERIAQEHGHASTAALVASAKQGEDWAMAALGSAGRWLGHGIANVVNLLDVEAVVIGGGLASLPDPWWEAVNTGIHHNLLHGERQHLIVQRATLGDDAGMLGAALLAEEWCLSQGVASEN